MSKWMEEFKSCNICSWDCKVNRVEGEKGVCRLGLPEVAYLNVSKVTESVTITFLGCCFRCIYCNAYRLSQYPSVGWFYKGFLDLEQLVSEISNLIDSNLANKVKVSSVSFTGGEPTIHWPFVEQLIKTFKKDGMKIGLATNGFSSERTWHRILEECDWINFEVKAFDDEVHKVITGAPVEPILRNLSQLITRARNKIRVVRTVVIPGINDGQVGKIASYIADLDETVPYKIIAFRPNFILYFHPGPSSRLMEKLTKIVRSKGLKDVSCSSWYPFRASKSVTRREMREYVSEEAKLAAKYLTLAGCKNHPRECGTCRLVNHCPAMLWEPWDLQSKVK